MNLGLFFIIFSNFAASNSSGQQQVHPSVILEKRRSPDRNRNPFLDRAEDQSQSSEVSLTTIGNLEDIPDDDSVDRNERPSPPLSVGDSLPESTGRNDTNQQPLPLGDNHSLPWHLWRVDDNNDELRSARDSLDGRPRSNHSISRDGLTGKEILVPIRDPQSPNTATAASLRETHYRLPELPQVPIREPPRLQTTSTPGAVRTRPTGWPSI